MLINWKINLPVDASLLTLLQITADHCLKCEGITVPCSVNVCFCDDPEIEQINGTYRNMQRSTDVLSFPTVDYPEGKTAGICEKLLRMEFDDESNTCLLGDIFISVPHMKQQAAEYGHSVYREGAYLLTHGICHLMGYDHMKEGEAKNMREKEEEILSKEGMIRSETLALSDETLLQLAREAMKNSYSPYSQFPVGAALLSEDGRVFLGCNVENASFGASNCAERTALFKAVSEGARSFTTLAIAANKPAWPCGICRQALYEFSPDLRVLVTAPDGYIGEKLLTELLPEGFGSESL